MGALGKGKGKGRERTVGGNGAGGTDRRRNLKKERCLQWASHVTCGAVIPTNGL